jgi:ankyrin repeat protein
MKSLEFEQMESRKVTIKRNHAKTCQWLLDHPDYKTWLDPAKLSQHYGFLWISGKPGAGKSTIMKFAYLNMQKTKKTRHGNGTASFFFNARGESLEKTTSGMYRSLLLQLLGEYRDLQTVLDDTELIIQGQEDCCPPLNVLKDLFRNAISALAQRQFTCFIDALDECDEQQVMDMVEFFEDLGEQAKENGIPFRICFSSRHYPYIVLKHGIRLTLEDQSGHAEDLSTYIKNRLRINNQALTDELQSELLRKAAGVFIWVVLVVQILNKECRQGGLALRKRLAEIPSDLSELFKDILTRDRENMDSLLLCIRWILFAERPLQPEEFRHALWSGLSLKDMADSQMPSAIQIGDRDSLRIVVISSSKGLAEITKSKSPTVQFIHESVRDFLLKDNGLHELWPGLEINWESSSHEELKQCCKFYLDQPSVSSSFQDLALPSNPSMREEITKGYPFMEYATQNILYHANAAAEVIPQTEFLSDFLLSSWIEMNNFFEKHTIRQYTSTASLIYILADKGYPNLVRLRLEEDSQVHILGERYRYPFFAALAGGHKTTVVALLNTTSLIDESGIDLIGGLNKRNDLKGYKGRTPLSWAVQNGHLGIVKCLLDTGSAINEIDDGGRTALSWTSERGHETMTRLLINKKSDINARIKHGSTPLSYASKDGYFEIVKLLIDKGADVNAQIKFKETPLLYASENGHFEIVKLLIDNRADVNSQNKFKETPLLYASRNGYLEIVKLLTDNGADVNTQDKYGYTPLFYASQNGHFEIVKLLIDNRADVKIQDRFEETPLSYASQNGHFEIVKLLIDNRADVNIQNRFGRYTPLFYASKNEHFKIVKLLIDNGADINTQNQSEETPLLYASRNGYFEIVKLLIDNGADVNAQNQDGYTPLLYASRNGYFEILKLLIDNGADVNAQNQDGYTSLSYTANGHEKLAILLIQKGANVNAPGFPSKTPQYGTRKRTLLVRTLKKGYKELARVLIDKGVENNAINESLVCASQRGYFELVELIISKEADINASDSNGRTALSWASMNGHETVVRLLIDNGADVNISDQNGLTALFYASKYNREEIARLLIDNGADSVEVDHDFDQATQ